MFSSSIIEYYLFDENISEGDVVKKIEKIGIHDFILTLFGGYDYIVGERGYSSTAGAHIIFKSVLEKSSDINIRWAASSIDSYTEQILKSA